LGSVFIQNISFAEMYLTESRAWLRQKEYVKAAERAKESCTRADQALSAIGTILDRFYDPHKIRHWRALLAGAVEYTRDTGKTALVAIKDQRVLRLYRFGKIVRTYPVELGKNPLQQKLRSGDLATPEGQYVVKTKKSGRQTKYYLALLLNYPNTQDWERFNEAKRRGQIPPRAQIGGLIEIHGDGGKGGDWTEGCLALTNENMREVFNQVEVGTPVIIIGSDGYSQTLSQLKNGRTWKNGKAS
jgi:murein L,D-transpeptidase YafK